MYVFSNAVPDASGRLADLEHQQPAARPQHAIELGECRGDVGDVPQRIAHADEIVAGVGLRQRLRAAGDELDTRELHLGHHARARVDADQPAGRADEGERLARDQTGTDSDVEHMRPFREAGALQRQPPVPRPGTEREHALDAIVVVGGVVEDAAQELLVLGLVSIVGRQRRVRAESFDTAGGFGCLHHRILVEEPHAGARKNGRRGRGVISPP